jgi:hypothetical protein
MSGAPLLDESLSVCGVMKRTRDKMAIAGGFATAVADVVAMADTDPRVKELMDAHRAYLATIGVDDPAEAKARWGALPERVAKIIARTGSLDALAEALEQRGVPVDLSKLAATEHGGRVARHLFGTDIRMLANVLADLLADRNLGQEDARDIFELVACCLPVTEDWRRNDFDRPVAWWIAPQAAEQLLQEVRAPEPRVAHVPTEERETAAMLVQRAASRERLLLHESEPHTDLTPEPASWMAKVDRVVRDVVRTKPDWRSDEKERARVVDWIRGRGYVLTLPPIDLGDAELKSLDASFGGIPFVLRQRTLPAALAGTDRVVRIRPDVDETVEKDAVFYYRNV